MKVKLRVYYQDASHYFEPNQVAEVDSGLGKWLVEQRKAELVEPEPQKAEEPPHYGAQAEPELRDDETKHQDVKKPRRGRGAK